MKRLLLICLFALAVVIVPMSAIPATIVQSGSGTATLYDATAGGADAGTNNGQQFFQSIAITVDPASLAAITITVRDTGGNAMYVSGREGTIPAGAGVQISWGGHTIAKIVATFTASGTVYVCPNAK